MCTTADAYERSLKLAPSGEARLLELAGALEDSPVLAEALRQLGRRSVRDSRALLLTKLSSTSADVRVAAIDALAELGIRESGDSVLKRLEDPELPVRRAAASALGKLGVKEAIEPLLRAGGIFKNKGRLVVWITDDERRMPVLMKSKVTIGSISVVLTEVKRS